MQQIKKYIVNLDLPEKDRWTTVIQDNKELCLNAYDEMDKLVRTSTIGKLVKYGLESVAKYFLNSGQALYSDEINSISTLLNVPAEKVLMCQLCYEMAAACTSVGMNLNGKMFHYRTMDWEMMFLKKLTIEVDFQRDNKTIFTAITWAGYIGVLTAIVPNQYSMSINFRRSNGNLVGNFIRATSMHWPIGYLCRILLEKQSSYVQFIDDMSNANTISPCYVTVCHKNGTLNVITRDCDKVVSIRTDEYNVVQTNKDLGETDVDILYSCAREKMVNELIKSDGDKLTCINDIITLFNKFPIINEETIYVCVMIPEDSHVYTYLA